MYYAIQPRNWSLFKRVFVTFEICLLTISVYIGSAIYSAGTDSVVATFGVSRVAATLGLTLFVAGSYSNTQTSVYVSLLLTYHQAMELDQCYGHPCRRFHRLGETRYI